MTADSQQAMDKLVGKTVLFIGVEAQHYTVSAMAGAAKFARSLGIDSISPKRGEGTEEWTTPAQLAEERKAVLAEGCGYAPFWYCDGPRFGLEFIPRECDMLKLYGDANDGLIIADMETEWDNQSEAAALFEEQMRPWQGLLGITTWADPAYQGWDGVLAKLAPACNVWIPQKYDNWLASQSLPSEATIIQPGVDLSQEFGRNNVLSIADTAFHHGQSVWIWEYLYAQDNPGLVREIVAAAHGTETLMIPTAPALLFPDTGFTHAIVTDGAQTLAQLAQSARLSNWYEELYKPNMDAIEAACRASGQPAGSSGGLLVPAGVKLNYNI